MAKGRTSSFKDAGKDLFGAEERGRATQQTQEVQVAQEVYDVQEVQDVHYLQQDTRREYGTTQGKKGQRAKRINMAFSDVNHEYITKESRRRGISATAFVNKIIDEYRNN